MQVIVTNKRDLGGRAIRERKGKEVRSNVALNPRRGSYCARNGAPDGLPVGRGPQQSSGWLDLKSSKIVVLKFGSKRKAQPVSDESDLVLDECAQQRVVTSFRIG